MKTGLPTFLPVLAITLLFAVPPVQGSAARATSPASLLGGVFDAAGPVASDPTLGPVAPSRTLVVELGLKYSHEGALGALLTGVQDPTSPTYHHYLTSSEFDARFGPSPSEVSRAREYLLSQGALSVTPSPDGLLLTVVLSAATASRLFETPLAWFQGPAGTYYGPTGTPTLPSALSGIVTRVDGLTDRGNLGLVQNAQMIGSPRRVPGGSGTSEYDLVRGSPDQIFWGTDYQAIYGELPLLDSGINGAGYAVATLLTSGWNQSANHGAGQNLPPYDPSALGLYYNASFPTGFIRPLPVGVPVTIGNATPPSPGVPPLLAGSTLGDDSGSVDENSLDLEMAGSMAPGAGLYEFYFSESLIAQSLGPAVGAFDLALSAALSYNYGGESLAAVSNSWGLTDVNDSTWNFLMEKAAAMGVTILASSGDQGDAPPRLQNHPQGQWPSFPATASNVSSGTVAVGGTVVTVSGTPTGSWDPTGNAIPPPGYDAPNISGVSSEVGWFTPSTDPNQYGGTEGGISLYVNEAPWQAESDAQSGIRYAASVENTHYARGVPDIAASGYGTIVFDSQEMIKGTQYVGLVLLAGTSVAAPLMAGLMAVVAEKNGAPLGFVDPSLYNVASYFQAHPGPADPFRDVTSGKNYLFNASTGWDPLTGWGAPNATLLAPALANRTWTGFIYNPSAVPGRASDVPPSGKPAPSNTQYEMLILVVVAALAFVAIVAVFIARRSTQQRASTRFMAPPPPPGPYAPGFSYGVVLCEYCHRTVQPGLGFCPYCGSWVKR